MRRMYKCFPSFPFCTVGRYTYIHLYPVLVGEDDCLHHGSVAEAEAEGLAEQLVKEIDVVARGEEDIPHHGCILP